MNTITFNVFLFNVVNFLYLKYGYILWNQRYASNNKNDKDRYKLFYHVVELHLFLMLDVVYFFVYYNIFNFLFRFLMVFINLIF